MLNDFIKQTINLIEKSNFNLQFPEICDIKLDGNSRQISMKFIDNIKENIDIKNNFLLISSISFLLIDTYLDTIYVELEGKSFKQRYESIPNENDIDIIFKESYRILKLIRNATIHSSSAISITNEKYIINYNFRSTEFKLEISKKSFENLISLVIFIIKNNDYNEYLISILRTYYSKINNDIVINDEFSNQLLNINSSIYLKNMRRYRVLNPRYEIIDSGIKIELLQINNIEREYSSADYIIEVNSKKYLVPEEILINNTIDMQEIENWEYFNLEILQ